MKKLTNKQQKLLDFIQDKNNWRPPTYKQMREFMEVKSNQTIIDQLKSIGKKEENVKSAGGNGMTENNVDTFYILKNKNEK